MQIKYQNPVWSGEFADPFVLKTAGGYYAYGTSSVARSMAGGSKAFPVLHSANLTDWQLIAGVIDALPGFDYWAPAVAERDGKFFLYYSAGESADNSTHRLRVAVASKPEGPFEDAGMLLPDAGFSIDAEPFRDPVDGRWHLFFSQDYFDGRVGTGIAAVPLTDSMTAVMGEPAPIIRPTSDWQIYERNRPLYGRTWDAWHTVEGACVVFHEGLYYCLYSGGAWHAQNYGVSYGVASHVLGPYEDAWSTQGPAILRTSRDVIGPGHNSVVIGPNNRTKFIVYHAWDTARTARRMCIDPLLWTPDGPRCAGPTTAPQVYEM
jgi:GH43 family beta-xylosidase